MDAPAAIGADCLGARSLAPRRRRLACRRRFSLAHVGGTDRPRPSSIPNPWFMHQPADASTLGDGLNALDIVGGFELIAAESPGQQQLEHASVEHCVQDVERAARCSRRCRSPPIAAAGSGRGPAQDMPRRRHPATRARRRQQGHSSDDFLDLSALPSPYARGRRIGSAEPARVRQKIDMPVGRSQYSSVTWDRRPAMKLMWFHLMPYTETARGFPRRQSVRLGGYPLLAVRSEARPPDVQTTSWTNWSMPPTSASTRFA